MIAAKKNIIVPPTNNNPETSAIDPKTNGNIKGIPISIGILNIRKIMTPKKITNKNMVNARLPVKLFVAASKMIPTDCDSFINTILIFDEYDYEHDC